MTKQHTLLLLSAAGIFIADIASKQWAVAALQNAPPVRLAAFLRFIYVENTGIAFGLFADNGEAGRWLLIIVAFLLIAMLIYYIQQTNNSWERLACALIIGGAAGNLSDRLRFGYVVDFVDVHIGSYHWPAFNIADAAISCGGVLFAYILLFKK